MRQFFLFLHRWLGLGAALVIAFLGISGAALVFRPELDARLNPQLLRVQPGASTASFQSIYETTRRQFPSHNISFLFAAKTPDTTHELWLNKGELRVYADPYSGAILGSRTEAGGFFPWLFRAHTHLFAGDVGESVAGWSGLILACLSVSGLVLWWPRAKSGWTRAFSPHLTTNWKGRFYELHRVGGFYLCILLLTSSLSGAALVWPDSASALASVLGTSKSPKAKASAGQWRNLDELVATANRAFPDGHLTRLSFPAKTGAPLVIRKKLPEEKHPNGMNNIALDAATGKILWVSDSRKAMRGERLMNLRYPLHIGAWGGNVTRILMVIGGLGAAFLSFSGIRMWLARLGARRKRRAV
ncbi:MAG TPA: PepSY-associated TM helix domain-containing protein [Abditibacterium sp.]|jgi:uncharacterized iron-regulated membrane protein